MPSITLKGFGGIRPRIDDKLLKEHEAVLADNCHMAHGSVESWRKRKEIITLAKTGLIKTIYNFNDTHWLHWNEDVDVVKGPISGDTTERTYFTGTDAPRVTNTTLVNISPSASGVITGASQTNPVVINDVAHDSFNGARLYIDNIVGMTELNGRYFTITIIDSDSFSLDDEDGTSHTLYVSGGTWDWEDADKYPEDSHIVGVPAPTVKPTVALVGTHTSPSNTAYVYTFVNEWGEESEPSPVSSIVLADFETGSVDITAMQPAPSGDYKEITKWRIYRVATGTSGAEYLFVAEVVINISTPQYNDSVNNDDLGEAIQTEGWILPPATLIGLTLMGNGIMAGFSGNDIYFSVPFIPYAWPEAYRLTTDYEIVGLGSFGNSLIVITKAFPYLITGTAPEQMSMDILSYRQPGVSKRGIVSVIGGVIWPSSNGLFYVGEKGAKLLTEEHYTREEWSVLIPTTMFAAFYDMNYVAFIPAKSKAIVFSISDNTLAEFVSDMDGLYSQVIDDRLYFVNDEEGVNTIFEFNAGGTRKTFTYKSKVFALNNRIAITSGRIYSNYGEQLTPEELAQLEAEQAAAIAANTALLIDTGGAIDDYAINEIDMNGDLLQGVPSVPEVVAFTFRLYGDEELVFEKQILDNKPFRIRTTNKYVDYQIEVVGQVPVQMVKIATSIDELRG